MVFCDLDIKHTFVDVDLFYSAFFDGVPRFSVLFKNETDNNRPSLTFIEEERFFF